MCNGENGRAAQGGAIVILKPAALHPAPARPSLHRELSLRFADDASSGRTLALFDRPSPSFFSPASASASASAPGSAAYILIHRSGDLRSDIPPEDALQPMHRFEIPADRDPTSAADSGSSSTSPLSLATKLDLSVGETGVIGRRASLVLAGQILGEGPGPQRTAPIRQPILLLGRDLVFEVREPEAGRRQAAEVREPDVPRNEPGGEADELDAERGGIAKAAADGGVSGIRRPALQV
ncbi:hypothetical protein D0864_13415 [Hortaea werneckii]|uniref:Uncharacterized protein n=1 Tax=Hortaea werneckii TaxID=91943 RepID=A0A3M7D173_HORWE|nr:hypothetical protein D0864_13415 [Hortaea werneckii]